MSESQDLHLTQQKFQKILFARSLRRKMTNAESEYGKRFDEGKSATNTEDKFRFGSSSPISAV